jgi:hypothetical protein
MTATWDDPLVTWDDATTTWDGESAVVIAPVPRVRYIELARPRFQEQRAPIYQEGTS